MTNEFKDYMSTLLDDERLSKLDVNVMYRLRGCSLGYVKDQKHLCDWTGKSSGAISKAVNRLEKLGYIHRDGKRIVSSRKLLEEEKTSSRKEKSSSRKEKTSSRKLSDDYTILPIEKNRDNSLSIKKQDNLPAQITAKNTICTNQSISREDLKAIILNPTYGNGDIQFVKYCFESMRDWSDANSKKKANWTAALRNWIKKERKDRGLDNIKQQPKTFSEIEENNFQQGLNRFMEATSK